MNKILEMVGRLCALPTALSFIERLELDVAYGALGVPFTTRDLMFSEGPDAHASFVLGWIEDHQHQTVPPNVSAILNGDRKRTRQLGLAAYRLFAYGTDCQCCLGWRLLVGITLVTLAAGVFGFLSGRLL